jgi:oligoendopeptidase F
VNSYHFPYPFGYLLSEGLQARARKEGPGFFPRYEELLRLTGSYGAEDVVARSIGVDLTQEEFWQEAINGIAGQMGRFEEIIPRLMPSTESGR